MRTYLAQYLDEIEYSKLKENFDIQFEMPSFCSGDYTYPISKDEKCFYIEMESRCNYFNGCRNYYINGI